MDINQLKQEARELERQGRYREALAMYRHALTSLEGSPQLLRELPLYVKAGDLYLKLDKVKAGVSLYEQVGKIYAVHGSAKSVGAVCIKVVRAMPERAHVYPRLVRIMLERGHVGPARSVLALWAEHARLKTTHALLEALDEVSDEDMRAVLDSVLEMSERLESSPKTSSAAAAAEEDAAAPSAQAPSEEQGEHAPQSEPEPPAEAPEAAATTIPDDVSEPEAPAAAPPAEEPEAPREPEASAEPEPPAEPVDEAPAAEADTPEPEAEPEEPVDDGLPLIQGTEPPETVEPEIEMVAPAHVEEEPVPVQSAEDETPEFEDSPRPVRPSFGSVLMQQPKTQSKSSKRGILIGVAAVVIVATLIAVPIVWLGLVPIGGAENGDSGDVVPAAEPEPAIPGVVAGDSGSDTTLPLALDPNPQFAAEPVGGAEDTTTGAADEAEPAPATQPVAESPPPSAPEGDRAPADTTPTVPTVQAPSVAPALPTEVERPGMQADLVMAIAGLTIESTTAVTRRGISGSQVVQVIESGEEVTVFSARSASGPTSPTVTIEGETTVGEARVNGYLVEVRGAVETAVMWQLLDRVAARSAPGN